MAMFSMGMKIFLGGTRADEEVAERDRLEESRRALEKRLEGRETELRDKEEELFLHLERSLRLDDEIERLKAERDACIAAREQLEREQTSALRQLQLQATQNEITRRNLERARQDVVRQATVIRAERDALERENVVLKEKLRVEQVELGAERRRREEGIAVLTHEAATLRHAARHLRAAAVHATSCRRRRRCSVCLYAKRT
ncbi:reticulocyte-binding protein 2 homolog a-like, partial [Fopius arisanus]|uniref:Reticulocyte-binding protein 2 homolog a-like n=1 Tax=Fopius arisanus TaxID=64838 RepID=A0A9R1TMH0_9HYME